MSGNRVERRGSEGEGVRGGGGEGDGEGDASVLTDDHAH